jgi:DedD protein
MPTAQKDTEIVIGTGRMLAFFFTLVLVCAFFFAIGFSLGRKTSVAVAGGLLNAPAGSPTTVVRPSPAKNDAAESSKAAPQSGDFSFYKAVGEKNAEAALAPADSKTPSAASNAADPSATTPGTATSGTEMPPKDDADAGTAAPVSGGYYVQVAAVSRKEDAEALVEALKKKQYPAFIANNASTDKFYRVQVGPYAETKDAEAMRARLVGDGYNPIVKK